MNYTVIYRPTAEQALTDLWTAGPDRAEIAHAADVIDAVVGENPEPDFALLVHRLLCYYVSV